MQVKQDYELTEQAEQGLKQFSHNPDMEFPNYPKAQFNKQLVELK